MNQESDETISKAPADNRLGSKVTAGDLKEKTKNSHENRWNTWYDLLVQYHTEHGNCNIATTYRLPGTGEALGNWVDYQRKLLKKGKLAPSREAKLAALMGQAKHKSDVDAAMARLLAQQETQQQTSNNQQQMSNPQNTDVLQGYRVGVIPSAMKTAIDGNQNGTGLATISNRALQQGGDAESRWNSAYNDLLVFAQEFGHCNVPQDYRTSLGRCLGKWLDFQRQMKKRGRLRADRDEKMLTLERSGHLNMYTGPRRGHKLSLENVEQWHDWFEALLVFGKSTGHYNVPRKYSIPGTSRRLGRWLQNQRQHKRRGDIRPERLQKLQELVNKGLLTWYDDSEGYSTTKGGSVGYGDDDINSDDDDGSVSESDSVDAAAVLHKLSSTASPDDSQADNNLVSSTYEADKHLISHDDADDDPVTAKKRRATYQQYASITAMNSMSNYPHHNFNGISNSNSNSYISCSDSSMMMSAAAMYAPAVAAAFGSYSMPANNTMMSHQHQQQQQYQEQHMQTTNHYQQQQQQQQPQQQYERQLQQKTIYKNEGGMNIAGTVQHQQGYPLSVAPSSVISSSGGDGDVSGGGSRRRVPVSVHTSTTTTTGVGGYYNATTTTATTAAAASGIANQQPLQQQAQLQQQQPRPVAIAAVARIQQMLYTINPESNLTNPNPNPNTYLNDGATTATAAAIAVGYDGHSQQHQLQQQQHQQIGGGSVSGTSSRAGVAVAVGGPGVVVRGQRQPQPIYPRPHITAAAAARNINNSNNNSSSSSSSRSTGSINSSSSGLRALLLAAKEPEDV